MQPIRKAGWDKCGRKGEQAIRRAGETALGRQTWWGEAPVRPENINEAADVGKFQGFTRPIRMPSPGSVVPLVSRFPRNGRVHSPYNAPHLVHAIDRGSASKLV